MPELPEVETVRRGSAKTLRGKTVRSVVIKRSLRVKRWSQFRVSRGMTVAQVQRRGKLLLFKLRRGSGAREEPLYLLAHLMMTGRLLYWAAGHKAPLDVHTRAVIIFTDGSLLLFADTRRFGWLRVASMRAAQSVLGRFGIEPLTASFTWQAFRSALRSRGGSVKSVLLDQRTIAGLGNIYADEACFHARVRPDRPVHSLTDAELRRLHRGCAAVVSSALARGGTTFATFRDARGKRGRNSSELAVYGRGGKHCLRCARGVISVVRLGGRGTSFCPACQS